MAVSLKATLVITSFSILVGCSAKNDFALSEAQASANREYTERLQQHDRDRDNIERNRRADAFARATRHTKGGLSYSPSSTNTTTTVIVPK